MLYMDDRPQYCKKLDITESETITQPTRSSEETLQARISAFYALDTLTMLAPHMCNDTQRYLSSICFLNDKS